ncbi:MAG: helix-turn-helix transcriptional regulator [Gemmatimonadota bacterium]|jgi:AraC-like DNA-binding protein
MSGQILRTVAEVILAGLEKTEARDVVGRGDLGWMEGDEPAIPLAPYRELLQRVLDRFGGGPILQAGLELRHAVHPILFVLLNSDRPEVLIQKEDRLSRYIHSRHRVRIVASEPGRLVLEHAASGSSRPRPTENLASCGQHVALLEMIGARGLTLRLPRSARPEAPAYHEGTVGTVAGTDGFELWDFRWDEFVPSRTPMAGLDDLLLDQARLPEIQERPGIAPAVERIVREDLGRRWSLEVVAGRLFMSTRTLQRKLKAVQLTFTELVMRVRVAEAMRLLRDSELNVTAIGYVCGFADSAHFSHSFKRVAGETPGRWRDRGGALSG